MPNSAYIHVRVRVVRFRDMYTTAPLAGFNACCNAERRSRMHSNWSDCNDWCLLKSSNVTIDTSSHGWPAWPYQNLFWTSGALVQDNYFSSPLIGNLNISGPPKSCANIVYNIWILRDVRSIISLSTVQGVERSISWSMILWKGHLKNSTLQNFKCWGC